MKKERILTSIFMLFYILILISVLVFIFIILLEIDKQKQFCLSNNGDYIGYEYKTGQCLIENGDLYEFYYIEKINGEYVLRRKKND